MGVPAGTRLGSYTIAEAIGAGGMGEVYRATDADLKRDVAIKILPQAFVDDADRIARFQREAEMLASLNHPNIAQIYGLERSGSATALVMELVPGPTLADRIAQGAIPTNESLEVALQIIAALEAAHSKSIVHRDLKPANIKLKPDGTVKVLDFGIAKPIEARAFSGPSKPELTTPAMTQAGMVLGTAAYMAPEQARGKAVDQRADIWAFGCVLYEMLTGQSAFGGEDVPITLARVLANDTDLGALPKSITPAVRHTLKLCLEKDTRKRIADIRDVRLALQGGFESPLRAGAQAPREPWRRALPYAVASIGGAVLAAGVFWSVQSPAPELPVASPLPVTRFMIPSTPAAPLTSLGGYDVAISSDGQKLAYFGRNPETGNVALYLRELDSLEARLIPGTEVRPAGTLNPFFSADGQWIAFLSPERGIMRASLEGAPVQKIVDVPAPTFLSGAWSSDDTIIYSSGPQLWRVAASGGTPEPLLPETVDAAALLAAPVFLPGEQAVLYGEIIGESESVMVLDLATRERRTLIAGGQNPFYLDSGHIVFARGNTLMAVSFDPAELAVTGEPVAVLTDVRKPAVNNAADFALAANGTLVYVPAGEADSTGRAIVWVDRAGATIARAISEPVSVARNPRLSPDGTRLLLTTGPTNNGDLWVYPLDGRPAIPLAVADDNAVAAWSPDGNEVAFVQYRGALADILLTRTNGSQLAPQPLRAGGLQGIPNAWSSAGELILTGGGFAGYDGVYATPATTTGELRGVVVTDAAEYDSALSADGQWLAYVSTRTGNPEIWVMAYPDGVAERISVAGGHEPRWSADGGELFYLQGTTLMAVTVETEDGLRFAAPVPLFNANRFYISTGQQTGYDVAADGRFLMLEEPTGANLDTPASIVVVENWSEEIRQRLPGAN